LISISSPRWNKMEVDFQCSGSFLDQMTCVRFRHIENQINGDPEVAGMSSQPL
jgi:hypothetical protein